MSACGGGQSNPDAAPFAAVAFKADGAREDFADFDPRPAQEQAQEVLGAAPLPSTKPSPGANGPTPAPAPGTAPAPSPAPAPAPAPAVTTAALAPVIDITKIPVGVRGVSVDKIGPTSELPAPSDGTGAFRTSCQFSHMAFDDPIVYPGQPGRSHLHVFFGNTGTNANSTVSSIANTGNSTCVGGTINRTAYWVPAMIDTLDGSPVAPTSMAVYYKTGYNGVDPKAVQPMPAGLRMIAGNAAGKAPVKWGPITFSCIEKATGTGANLYNVPTTCAVGDTIWARVAFPQCWDGINLDSPDHKSHMAYPRGGCPATHPVALPEVTLSALYYIKDASAPARWRLASDNYDPSLPAGYSSHADWFNGWKPEFMEQFVKNCDQPAKDCHTHLLGNGERMFGI